MMRQQQKDQLNLSSAKITVTPTTTNQPTHTIVRSTTDQNNRVRHVYLEQENVYGRYIPFLLLKDKLHSQIDSSGSSALVHMCSHNSPFIPLYLSTLKHGDPILNRPTNLGHTPLDVAGMYCKKEYVDMLREKGAIDQGRVDNWAIQGANITNWSGEVDPSKKALIHWAAYNNLPEVLAKYAEVGANVNEVDQNGNTPIDLAVISKSYESVEVLAKMGHRPKQTLLQKADSPYLTKLIKDLDESETLKNMYRSLKLSFIPLILLFQFLIVQNLNIFLLLPNFGFWFYLVLKTPNPDSKERPTKFFSEIVNRQINYSSNHKIYVLFLITFVLINIQTLIQVTVDSFPSALYFWITFAITSIFIVNLTIMLYGIFTNTTPSQLYESNKHIYLWKKIDYIIHRNMLTRVYHNPYRKDVMTNLQAYFSA